MTNRFTLRTPLDYVDRRWERVYQGFETRASTQTRFLMPVRVINFSAGGFLIGSNEKFKQHEPVLIELEGVGEIKGKVSWAKDGRIGGSFDCAIDVKALMDALDCQEQTVEPSAIAR